jgi:hypothetical protein
MEKSPNVKNSAIRLMIVTFLAIENNDFPAGSRFGSPKPASKTKQTVQFLCNSGEQFYL